MWKASANVRLGRLSAHESGMIPGSGIDQHVTGILKRRDARTCHSGDDLAAAGAGRGYSSQRPRAVLGHELLGYGRRDFLLRFNPGRIALPAADRSVSLRRPAGRDSERDPRRPSA